MKNLRPISTPDQAPTLTVQTQRRLQIMEDHFVKMNNSTSPYEQRTCLDRIKTEASNTHLDLGAWLKAQYFKLFMAEGGNPPILPVVAAAGYLCDTCGESFKSQPALNGHQKKHRS